jgi:hypothetical protein
MPATSGGKQTGQHSLQDLLALEDDADLLAISCPETVVPVWALIRVSFLRAIMSDMLFATDALIKPQGIRPHLNKIGFMMSTAWHNVRSAHELSHDICYFSTGLGNFRTDGKVRDRLVGYFAECYPERSLIYQGHGNWNRQSPFQFQRTLFSTPFNVYARLMARMKTNRHHRQIASQTVALANRNMSDSLGFSLRQQHIDRLQLSLAWQLAAFPIFVNYYADWFRAQGTRVLLKEDACYGGTSVPILHAAKLAGVVTAEYQHGAISKGHDGYNVAPALVNSPEFQQTLPDYLLTYGNWWSGQTNMPVGKIAVGNPHFSQRTAGNDYQAADTDEILILGDGIDTEIYLELCAKVARMTNTKPGRVLFRPHPIERERVARLSLPAGVELDGNDDLYQSLNRASMVISELSTGLFEAAGLNCKVLIWSTPKSRFAFPELPFASFSTDTELRLALMSPLDRTALEAGAKTDNLWASNWEANFRAFIEGVLVN